MLMVLHYFTIRAHLVTVYFSTGYRFSVGYYPVIVITIIRA